MQKHILHFNGARCRLSAKFIKFMHTQFNTMQTHLFVAARKRCKKYDSDSLSRSTKKSNSLSIEQCYTSGTRVFLFIYYYSSSVIFHLFNQLASFCDYTTNSIV